MMDQDLFALSRIYLDRLLSFVSNHNKYYAEFLTDQCELNSLPILTKTLSAGDSMTSKVRNKRRELTEIAPAVRLASRRP